MNLPSASQLKKLAKACRAAGITHFKQGDLELTISEDEPVIKKPVKATASTESAQTQVDNTGDWESLSDEQKLFWSIGGDASIIEEGKQ